LLFLGALCAQWELEAANNGRMLLEVVAVHGYRSKKMALRELICVLWDPLFQFTMNFA